MRDAQGREWKWKKKTKTDPAETVQRLLDVIGLFGLTMPCKTRVPNFQDEDYINVEAEVIHDGEDNGHEERQGSSGEEAALIGVDRSETTQDRTARFTVEVIKDRENRNGDEFVLRDVPEGFE